MPDNPKALARLQRLAERRRRADAVATAARDELYAEMKRANDAEEASLSAIARVLGISRQRVQAIVRGLEQRTKPPEE